MLKRLGEQDFQTLYLHLGDTAKVEADEDYYHSQTRQAPSPVQLLQAHYHTVTRGKGAGYRLSKRSSH